MKNVEIYTTPSCSYCRMTKEFFKENNITFSEHDVSKDAGRRAEMIEKSGQMGVPVIFVDGEMVVGFNRGKLSELLGVKAA